MEHEPSTLHAAKLYVPLFLLVYPLLLLFNCILTSLYLSLCLQTVKQKGENIWQLRSCYIS